MLNHIDIPSQFNRNSPGVVALGPDNTGQLLIELATREAGLTSLSHVDVLDVGCGVRFTQALINRSIPIRSYTGIDVHQPLVEYLTVHVAEKDARFRYVQWDVQNAMYNPLGTVRLSDELELPVRARFDLIWLFSVFTHLEMGDAEAMLRVLRGHIRPEGRLMFSAFIDPDLDGWSDGVPGQPLLTAYFGLSTMKAMLSAAKWRLEKHQPRDPSLPIVDYFVCSPADV